MMRAAARRALCAILASAGCALVSGRPLELEEAVRLAGDADAARLSAIAVCKSEARLAEARAAAWPRLSAQASASYLARPPAGIRVKAGELGAIPLPPTYTTFQPIPEEDLVFVADAEPTYFSLEATLTQPLVTWGKIANAIRLSELERSGSALELSRQGRRTRRDVQRAYFGALLAGRSRDLLARMREAYAGIVEDRRASFAAGAIARQLVLEAEAGLAALEARLGEAIEQQATAHESLAMLTGTAAGDLELVTAYREAVPALAEEALRSRALAQSEELALARNRLELARTAVALARGAGAPRPDLALSVEAGVSGQRFPFTADGWTDTWDWNVTVSVAAKADLVDAGGSRARVRQAEADLDAAVSGLAQAEKILSLGVRRALGNARAGAASLLAKEAQLRAAEETAKNAQVSYDNQLATRGDLRAAELALLSARLDRELAAFAVEDALDELEYLCAGLP